MRTEYVGDIAAVRDVEDCIRATKKYTKGVFRRGAKHPIQGEDAPSKVVTEHYEVYPEMEVGLDMKATDFWIWVWGDTPHIDVHFNYNYLRNRANIVIKGGNGVVKALERGVPGFSLALAGVIAGQQADK